ncbi:hypothetical protein [Methanobrevibacter sp. AbM4]|uniref:hypothetical protein n=1 Tax=Methanobrevibacter sp. AbM4 TaxID=224719 RepID=UPI0003348CBD|nr:hypothetical protein [Methanobrevibacter sp. AbM4]AGN15968.1 hypothetical protein Abm4_0044 [Methanobrevibacter sp. AbM4]
MKQSKGVVKKYSREYTRTLKSGKKKKYKTEQVQITIPKQDNVFENNEDVLILPYSENPFEEYEKTLSDLKTKYETLMDENNQLKEKVASYETRSSLDNLESNGSISNLESNSQSEAESRLSSMNLEESNLNPLSDDSISNNSQIDTDKKDLNNPEKSIGDKADKSLDNLKSIGDSVNKDSDDLEKPVENKLISEESFRNDYKDDIIYNLQEEYIDLTKRYEELQKELSLLKNDQLSNEYLIRRLKKFILNLE